jgi:Synaptobrevin
MSQATDTVRSVTIIRIRDAAVFVEEAHASNAEECFQLARSVQRDLEDFDKKRNDEGQFEKPDGVLYYEIDTESIAHLVYTSKDYPSRAARALLKEMIKRFENSVPEPDGVDADYVKSTFTKGVKEIIKKYLVAPDLPDAPPPSSETTKSMGSKVDQARDKLAKQLQQAATNEQDLRIIDDRSKRAKLIANEMEYESAGLNDTMGWRNKKLMIIAGAVGVGLVLTILIIALA